MLICYLPLRLSTDVKGTYKTWMCCRKLPLFWGWGGEGEEEEGRLTCEWHQTHCTSTEEAPEICSRKRQGLHPCQSLAMPKLVACSTMVLSKAFSIRPKKNCVVLRFRFSCIILLSVSSTGTFFTRPLLASEWIPIQLRPDILFEYRSCRLISILQFWLRFWIVKLSTSLTTIHSIGYIICSRWQRRRAVWQHSCWRPTLTTHDLREREEDRQTVRRLLLASGAFLSLKIGL